MSEAVALSEGREWNDDELCAVLEVGKDDVAVMARVRAVCELLEVLVDPGGGQGPAGAVTGGDAAPTAGERRASRWRAGVDGCFVPRGKRTCACCGENLGQRTTPRDMGFWRGLQAEGAQWTYICQGCPETTVLCSACFDELDAARQRNDAYAGHAVEHTWTMRPPDDGRRHYGAAPAPPPVSGRHGRRGPWG